MARHTLSGELFTGKGEATFFTTADWARAAFKELVDIDPWPGTLNLRLTEEPHLETWAQVRRAPGLVIPAPNPDWCDGRCYRALLAGRIPAATVVPDVESYPDDQVEIIAAVHLREALNVKDGDVLTIEITV